MTHRELTSVWFAKLECRRGRKLPFLEHAGGKVQGAERMKLQCTKKFTGEGRGLCPPPENQLPTLVPLSLFLLRMPVIKPVAVWASIESCLGKWDEGH